MTRNGFYNTSYSKNRSLFSIPVRQGYRARGQRGGGFRQPEALFVPVEIEAEGDAESAGVPQESYPSRYHFIAEDRPRYPTAP